MSFHGDLADVSLATLIQLLCGKNSRSGLVLQGPRGTGELFFDAGVLVDARAGTARGDDAVYALLAWEDAGRFEVVEGMAAPGRSVTSRWTRLLMTASRAVDQRRHEAAIADALIGLLSNLEQQGARLRDPQRHGSPTDTLVHLVHILNAVAAFGDAHRALAPDTRRIDTHLATAGAGALVLGAVDSGVNQLSVRRVEALLESSRPDQRSERFVRVSAALLGATGQMLEHMIEDFPPAVQSDWLEVCRGLLDELRAGTEANPHPAGS